MRNKFYDWGKNFSTYCKNKLHNYNDFESFWNEAAKSELIKYMTEEDKLTLDDKVEIMKGLGNGLGEVGVLFSINVQIWAVIMPIKRFANDIIQTLFLDSLINGEIVGAHAISEPYSGSDVFDMKTEFVETENDYILNGSKCFVSNVPQASLFLVYAIEKGKKGFSNISCFIVPKKTNGVVVGEKIDKIGMNHSPFGDVSFCNCTIPKSYILGKKGKGMSIFNYTMIHERPLLLAFQIGIMEKQFEDCLEYTKNRQQGNKRIIEYQSVSNRIANMKVRLHISQLIIDDYLANYNSNSDILLKSSIAKLVVSENLLNNSLDAMRNYGTIGYMDGFKAATQLVDSLGSIFYSGTSDIQRNIISSLL